jgi:hypothetical protein
VALFVQFYFLFSPPPARLSTDIGVSPSDESSRFTVCMLIESATVPHQCHTVATGRNTGAANGQSTRIGQSSSTRFDVLLGT